MVRAHGACGGPYSSEDLRGGRPEFPLEDRPTGHLGRGHPVCVTQCRPGGCCCTGFSEPGCTHRWCENPRPAWACGAPRTAALSVAETGSAAVRAGWWVCGQSLLQSLHPCDIWGTRRLADGVRTQACCQVWGTGLWAQSRQEGWSTTEDAWEWGASTQGHRRPPSPRQPHLQVFPHL